MWDKIGDVKGQIWDVVKCKKMTRTERYDLIKKKIEQLSETELSILINEYHRELNLVDGYKDFKDVIIPFITSIGILITVFGIFATNTNIANSKELYEFMIYVIGTYAFGAVLVLWALFYYRGKKLYWIQYILDVLEK